MRVVWTPESVDALVHIHDYLNRVNPQAADAAVLAPTSASLRLTDFPRLGERLERFRDREVRHLIVGSYDIRYEIVGATIRVLDVWNTRQQR